MEASGIDLRKIEDLHTLVDYTAPLMEFMESLSQEEKVILAGHSYGGMNLGLAMENYPKKIYAAVFLTALMLILFTCPPMFWISTLRRHQKRTGLTPNLYHMVPLKSL
ncbi:hypothetical protein RDI58_004518 [Solanum bulbocastanum]|uniref:Uncharacterized protein n=1 Tax=Solanum bulbocastanum TaxID=147425 RepID=A0AAN8U6P1_SOLBU